MGTRHFSSGPFGLLSFCLRWLLVFVYVPSLDAYLHFQHSGSEAINIGGIKIPLNLGGEESEMRIIKSFMKHGSVAEIFRQYSEPVNVGGDATVCFQGISAECCNDTLQLLSDLSQGQLYAEQMIDAAAKLPSGVLQGKIAWIGNYDECVNIMSPANNRTGRQITGKYCMGATATGIAGRYLMNGVCVPHSCTANDLNIWVYHIYASVQEKDQTLMSCEEPMPLTKGAKAALAACGIIAFLVVLGTLGDILMTYNENRKKSGIISSISSDDKLDENSDANERTGLLSHQGPYQRQVQDHLLNTPQASGQRGKVCQVMVSFSILTNTRKLLTTSTATGHLTSLNGMRVLSMWWIILGHTYLFASISMAAENTAVSIRYIRRFSFQAILNGTVSVDTFFFMSGLLVTYLYLKNRRENPGPFNWALFYFHRFWRLTPVYAFCIMVWGVLFFHTLRGPVMVWRTSPQMKPLIDECSESWWANLLYINNFYPYSGDINQQCMGWSWYLANDMQFYIISPLILILLYRNRKIGIAVCVGLITSCIFIRAMTAFEFGIHVPTQTITKHTDNYYGQHAPLYNKMYTRIAPYIVGMLLGYVLHRTDCRVRLSKAKVLIGWAVAIVIGLSVVYGLYDYYHNSYNASLATSVTYLALNRFAWSVALAWVTFACVNGYGGLVNSILSWSFWAPLGRLTYCAYLIHPMVMTYFFNQPSAYFISDTNMICYYIGILVLSYAAAYIVSMCVEAPMIGLEKILISLLKKLSRRRQNVL